MSEFIGSRISLISRSDIRYVGILHEINSENSTVALEQVVSFGTEGRRGDPAKEIPATDNVYEYIVFRGSDVKDLRIEEPAKPQPQKPPQMPDDPAILQSTARPPSYSSQLPSYSSQSVPQYQSPPAHPYYSQNPYGYTGYHPAGPPFPTHLQPQQQQPQQQPQPQPQPVGGFTRPGPPPQALIGAVTARPQQQVQQPQQPQDSQEPQQSQPPQQAIGPRGNPQPLQQQQQSKSADQQPKSTIPVPPNQPGPSTIANEQPTFAIQDSKPSAPPASTPQSIEPSVTNNTMTSAKGRSGIVPALPLANTAQQTTVAPTPSSTPSTKGVNVAPTTSAPKTSSDDTDTTAAVQDLAHKVSQLKTSSISTSSNTHTTAPVATEGTHRPARQPSNRGRGNFRSGYYPPRKVEIPTADFDFESSNAKFNKQDLIKEVIASEDLPAPVATNGSATNGIPAADGEWTDQPLQPSSADGFYSKKKSFFDNISCENKERAEAKEGDKPRGAQWRGEETKKNIETFGQGSVDAGRYPGRGGWRGRGRAYRGYRGGYRGWRGNAS